MKSSISKHADNAMYKACDNIQKWGLQDVETLLLAAMEELGELSQAVLKYEHEDGEFDDIRREAEDLAALPLQILESIDELEEDLEENI